MAIGLYNKVKLMGVNKRVKFLQIKFNIILESTYILLCHLTYRDISLIFQESLKGADCKFQHILLGVSKSLIKGSFKDQILIEAKITTKKFTCFHE